MGCGSKKNFCGSNNTVKIGEGYYIVFHPRDYEEDAFAAQPSKQLLLSHNNGTSKEQREENLVHSAMQEENGRQFLLLSLSTELHYVLWWCQKQSSTFDMYATRNIKARARDRRNKQASKLLALAAKLSIKSCQLSGGIIRVSRVVHQVSELMNMHSKKWY